MTHLAILIIITPKLSEDGILAEVETLNSYEDCIVATLERMIIENGMAVKTYGNDYFGLCKKFTRIRTIGNPQWNGYLTLKFDSEIEFQMIVDSDQNRLSYFKKYKEMNLRLAQLQDSVIDTCNCNQLFTLRMSLDFNNIYKQSN